VLRDLDGVPHAIPGDWALLQDDGTVTLLGRGSGSVNTGGEKVWPEEVEEALKEHPAVADALVVGVADDEWGQRVAAVVALEPGRETARSELDEWLAGKLASYKRPRHIVVVDEVHRSPVGKPDYEWARAVLTA
jgi:fatty-acyl-CoA synthase